MLGYTKFITREGFAVEMGAKNIEIRYVYRDAANNKQCEVVIVANPAGYTAEDIEAALLSQFLDIQCWPDILHFQPELLGWPTAYFDSHDESEDDLNVHELDEALHTDKSETLDFDLSRLMRRTAREVRG